MHNIRTEATRDEILAAEDAKGCRYALELDRKRWVRVLGSTRDNVRATGYVVSEITGQLY